MSASWRSTFRMAVLAVAVLAAPAISVSLDGDEDPLDRELAKIFEDKLSKLSRERREEIVELVDDLTKAHPEDRQRLREELLPYGSDATPFLLEQARSKSHDKARAALVALAMIRDPKAAPFLEKTLSEGKHFVTMFAALALGKLGLESSVEPLRAVVVDRKVPDAFDRAASAVALARIGMVLAAGEGKNAIDPTPLLPLLEEEGDTKVISAVLMALGRAGDPKAFESIVERATTTLDRVRRAAILALGDLGHPPAVPVLLERLRDEDERAVAYAAGALSAYPGPKVARALLEAITQPGLGHATRAVILRALGAQPPSDEIRDEILEFATESRVNGEKVDDLERGAAVAALRSYDGPAVRKALGRLVRSDDPKVQGAAIAMLAQRGAIKAGTLRGLLRSDDRVVAESAALGLARIEEKKAKKVLETQVPRDHPAFPFVRNVIAGFEKDDPAAYFQGWLDEWVSWLGGTSDALRRNLANEQLIDLFELRQNLTKTVRPGSGVPPGRRMLSTAQQDLRLWLEYEPYFDPPR